MKNLKCLLSLPATLLPLILAYGDSASAQELQWPYNLPRTAKYYPEHEARIKRDLAAREKLGSQPPVGMRKMSEDEGEMFLLHYWDFSDRPGEDLIEYANASVPMSAPMAQHFSSMSKRYKFPGHSLFRRDNWGSCPSGTKSCTDINQPDSCCGTDDQCITVSDSGNGNVGCCPAGQSCGNTVSGCDESQGQTSCPNSGNGGCCIAGYSCFDVGCVLASTQTVTTNLPTTTVTTGAESTISPTASPASSTSPEGTTVVVAGAGSTYTTTLVQTTTATAQGAQDTTTVLVPTTVTFTPTSQQTSTTTSGQGPLTCSPSFSSCPASLGGGCCYSGYACGAIECTPSTTTTSTSSPTAALPPQRPTTSTGTSVSQASDTSTTTTPAPSSTSDQCPTGFYLCSAYYPANGCCRVGRNCDSTSCPSSDSTAIISTDGATIVAPTVISAFSTTTVGGAQGTQGSCANGWYSCGADVGGGCCQSGFVCGTSACSATASQSGEQSTPKEAPSEGSVVRWVGGFVVVGLVSAVGMVWL